MKPGLQTPSSRTLFFISSTRGLALLLNTGDASRTEVEGFASFPPGSFISVDVKGRSLVVSSSSGDGAVFGEMRGTGKRALLFVVIGDLMVEASGGKTVPTLDSKICRYSSLSASLTQWSVANPGFFSFFTWLKNLSAMETYAGAGAV